MKNLLYSLLVVLTFLSCGKDDPEPGASVEGKWNLTSADIAIKSLFGDEDNSIDFKNQNVYLDFTSNTKFSGNIVMSEDMADFIRAGELYESDYQIKGNEITLQIYDEGYDAFVPIKLKIDSSSDIGMVLKITKAELVETMQAYDKLDESTDFSMMLSMISSVNATLNFSK